MACDKPPITTADGLTIVRGDLIQGGTKKLALLDYLPKRGQRHFAYAGTVFGSGGWALAEACAELGYASTLFIARNDLKPHWLDRIAALGSTLIWCDPKPVDHIHMDISNQSAPIDNLPLGYDDPEFIMSLSAVISAALKNQSVTDLWLPALSGVLARAAALALPETQIHAVSAVKHTGDCGRATLYFAPEKFHQPARMPPPYPSCPFSDAKVWQFAREQKKAGVLIWNTSL